ncbi:MAG: PDZ domain-containing protein [Pseudomonadota bacterium]
MSRVILSTAGVSLVAAGAIAGAWFAGDDQPAAVAPEASSVSGFDASAPLEARIAALETALGQERQARQLLQEEVLVLTDTLDQLRDTPRSENAGVVNADVQSGAGVVQAQRVETRRRGGRSPEERQASLEDAGFSPAEAARILRRESEIQMEALQARYEAQRSGEPFDFRGFTGTMREELGDENYARYLEANGRETAVTISSVYESSPALTAGLRPGDEIRYYDGQRVFNMDEIVDLTMSGTAGENVIVDISRDGVPMQISMPRGPLGVSGGRRFRPR